MNEISGEDVFKAYITSLIIDGKVKDALSILSNFYKIDEPRIIVKRVKGHMKNPAIYSLNKKTIYVQSGEYYNNPYIILHEFYHHLRNIGGKHRGTEDNADKFAENFINSYKKVVKYIEKS